VDFHVRKDTLKAGSDFFDGMFSVPSGKDGADELLRDGKIVLSLSESADVLYVLLHLAYPRQSWGNQLRKDLELDLILGVHSAANKYQFPVVERLAKELLEGPALLNAHPHRLFAIARLRELPTLARKAALHTLKSPILPSSLVFPEMDLLPWSTGQKLYEFHRQCSALVVNLVKQQMRRETSCITRNDDTGKMLIWWSSDFVGRLHEEECGPDIVGGRAKPAPWFPTFIARLAARLQVSPASSSVRLEGFEVVPSERVIIDACAGCRKHADQDLENFIRQLAERVERENVALGELLNSRSTLVILIINCRFEAEKLL
jgi:hypothetical protein